MSIRSNPMKAVPVLLKRVKATRTKFLERGSDDSLDGKLEKLSRELNKIEDVFMIVKKNQDELLDALHEVDAHLRKLDSKKLDRDMDHFCKRIRDCAHKLLPMEAFESEEDHEKSEIVESSSSSSSPHDPSSTQHNDNNHLLLPQPQPININFNLDGLISEIVTYDTLLRLPQPHDTNFSLYELTYEQRYYLNFLKVFPEGAVIKKRLAIYWWIGLGIAEARRGRIAEGIGLGIVETREGRTAEEMCEDVFDELLSLKVIIPYGNGKSPIVNKFQIHPHIRPLLDDLVRRENAPHLGSYINYWEWCLVLEQQNVMLALDSQRRYPLRNIYNAISSYLNFGSQWLDKEDSLFVLQLGRWQNSPSHHIEVGNQDFLNNLTNQRQLRYLSLRGISRIFQLPPSITKVESLEILDLKACHNLETLPDDISSMKSLTHLILSHCYLLDGMPKGIDKLTQLQVLKGFLLGSSRNTPCRISDLANLKQLRRLSIHIRSEAVIKDGEFESLEELPKLQHLKISWGVFDKRYSEIQINLPPSFKKLHLEGFAGKKIPERLKPSKLPRGLKELCLTGGKLESMNHEETNQWDMEIVRLKYVNHLEIDMTHLKMLFPSLRYALIKPISNQSYTEWSID